ncbi:alpha/beta hydrolase [soil metagenome]
MVLGILILAYFGIGLFVASRLTAPSPAPMEATPASVGLDFRDIRLKSTDGIELAAWWVPGQGSSRAAVLVHGFGGNKSNEQILETARIYARSDYNVLMIDLRAHGQSDGDRRTLGYQEVRDVHGALDWLESKDFRSGQTILHGWSMGGATVVRAAPGAGVAAVVEEAGYADLPLLLSDTLPENSGLPALFNPGTKLMAKVFLGFDASAVVPKQDAAQLYEEGVPLFGIHSTTDETVPFEHAGMFREATPNIEFWKLEGYAHVEAYKHPEYRERLSGFLRELEGREAA